MHRILPAAALAAVLGACASVPSAARAGGGPSPLSSNDPPLPVAAFIDSAGLHRALLSAPPAPAEFKSRALFWVDYDSTGALASVKPAARRAIPPAWGDTMATILRASVKPRITPARATSQMVWLVSGGSPRISVLGDVIAVQPSVINGTRVAEDLSRAASQLASRDLSLAGQQRTAMVRMSVDDNGVPDNFALLRSTLNPRVDAEVISVAQKLRFRPATVDGVPVRVLVVLPIVMVFPEAAVGRTSSERSW